MNETMKKFREKVARGKKNLSKLREKARIEDVVFCTVTDAGSKMPLPLSVHIKELSCADYEEFIDIQRSYDSDEDMEGTQAMTKYAAAVIIGALDPETKERIFSADDVEFIEDKINTSTTMKLANSILVGAGLDGDSLAEKKPD